MRVGFVVAAVFFIATAIALMIFAPRAEASKIWFVALATLHTLAGITAVLLLFLSPEPLAFLLLAAFWAFGAAALEFSSMKRDLSEHGTLSRAGRDWRTMAIGAAFFGLLMAFSPLIGVADEVSLTGLFGAYAAIVGVYHAIAAASLAFGRRLTGEQTRSLENES